MEGVVSLRPVFSLRPEFSLEGLGKGSKPNLHSENLAPLPEPGIELMTAKCSGLAGKRSSTLHY